ncbi:O-antigen polymerase [Vibrio splendidus]
MSKYIYNYSRLLVVFSVIYILFLSDNIGYSISRVVMLSISIIIFFLVSFTYEHRFKYITVTYLIYFFVCFLSFNLAPFTYINNESMLGTAARVTGASIPPDLYSLYFYIFVCVSFVFSVFIFTFPKVKYYTLSFNYNYNEVRYVALVSLFLLVPLQLISGDYLRKALITFSVYFLCVFISCKKSRKDIVVIFCCFVSLLVIFSQLSWRFIALQYIFPIILFLVIYITTISSNVISIIQKVFFVLGLFLALVYGVVSELYKLKGIESIYDVVLILDNFEVLIMWIDRQSYRVFQIWTVLGGNIINFADQNGYFFGITYIKSLSSILGFDYISLPKISADMVGANYAQPGVIAEGYANFGFFGAVISMLVVLLWSQFVFYRSTLINRSNLRTLLLLVPFCSVIFDGGSLNAIIFNFLFIYITFSLALYMKLLNSVRLRR